MIPLGWGSLSPGPLFPLGRGSPSLGPLFPLGRPLLLLRLPTTWAPLTLGRGSRSPGLHFLPFIFFPPAGPSAWPASSSPAALSRTRRATS